jgi:hypothetical protein
LNLSPALELARSGKLYPAVILHGSEAETRQQAAVDLALTLLCRGPEEERPCRECRHCRRVTWPEERTSAFHPDFRVLQRDLRTVTSVEATKAFLRTAQVTPFEARGQVFVVANAETLSGEAANALLKTLEEPYPSAPRHFLLLAPSQFDLLATLRSRSLAVFLGSPPRPRGGEIDQLARRFDEAVAGFEQRGSPADLMAAAAVLKEAGSWADPRAATPWERAAAVVLESLERGPREAVDRRKRLDLAGDLLGGVRLRVRGISPERILEGLLHRNLARRTSVEAKVGRQP